MTASVARDNWLSATFAQPTQAPPNVVPKREVQAP